MNRLALPRVEVDAESAISEVFQEKFNLPGLRYYLCDATTDLDIPVFFTLLVGDSNYGRMGNAGSQASVSPTRAALKSFVEAAHGRPYVRYIVQQNPGWSYKSDFSNIVSFQDHAIFYTMAPQHFDELDFLIGPRPPKALSRMADHSTGRALGDIDYCLSQLGRLGFDVIVVDLTTPDIRDLGFAVVRVIIPGLQLLHGVHHLPFLGNPRLYQLPVTLGYREQPLSEDGLNPYPHPLP